MSGLSVFRSVFGLTRVFSTPVRGMAVKAAAASTASKTTTKANTKATTKASTKASKATKTTKAASAKKTTKKAVAKPKKAAVPAKPKKVKIPALELPKRPASSWALFYIDHLDKLRAAGKPIIPTVETTVASAQWKQLSDAQKMVYTERYNHNLAEFKRKMEARLDELTPEEFKLENTRRRALRAAGKKGAVALKDPNAPSRPLSSYFLFAKEQRVSGKFAKLPVKEQAKAIADVWGKIGEAEKATYQEKAQTALASYKTQKAAYESSA
ncbi:exp1-like protein [Lunasporangiospora selenospora]|uniref:Exp1-like protein n=1 Tax=Lunasporangiospora selenospora TaxID=979761 RepID=A0A9P6KHG7_9FUNG|nr:exp1-like protein [Lunasporangiospora selenospora]